MRDFPNPELFCFLHDVVFDFGYTGGLFKNHCMKQRMKHPPLARKNKTYR